MQKRAIVALVIIGLISIVFFCTSCSKKGGGMPPAVVEASPVKLQSWQTQVQAIGTLSASQGVVIKPEVGGRITGIYFHSGDHVQANAPLIQLDPQILKAQLAVSQAKIILSKANYNRFLQLFAKRVSSQADLDTALSTYQSDTATLAQNQALLQQTLIRAPFEGRLGLRLINLGDYINAGDPITNVQDLDPIRVDFSVPEVYLGQLGIGEKVLIRTKAFPNQTFEGKVYALDATVDPNTHGISMRASIPNKNQKLLPGIFVEITLLTGKPEKVITIPETALSYAEDGQYVYKIVNNLAIKTKIQTGEHKNNQVAVLSGLKEGDVIVSAGQFKIVGDQAPVTIAKGS